MVRGWNSISHPLVPAWAGPHAHREFIGGVQNAVYSLETQEPACLLLSSVLELPWDKCGQGWVSSSHCSKEQFGGSWGCHGSYY